MARKLSRMNDLKMAWGRGLLKETPKLDDAGLVTGLHKKFGKGLPKRLRMQLLGVHDHFNTQGVKTGRLNSQKVQLSNAPKPLPPIKMVTNAIASIQAEKLRVARKRVLASEWAQTMMPKDKPVMKQLKHVSCPANNVTVFDMGSKTGLKDLADTDVLHLRQGRSAIEVYKPTSEMSALLCQLRMRMAIDQVSCLELSENGDVNVMLHRAGYAKL